MSASSYITSIPVFEGEYCNYYLVDGVKYHMRFPLEWALNHMTFYNPRNANIPVTTGPKTCLNCAYFGSHNGMFIGYCAYCLAQYETFGSMRGCSKPKSIKYGSPRDVFLEMYPYMFDFKFELLDDKYILDEETSGIMAQINLLYQNDDNSNKISYEELLPSQNTDQDEYLRYHDDPYEVPSTKMELHELLCEDA